MSSRTPTFTALTNGGPLAGLLSSVTMMDAKIRADDPSASCRDRYKPPDMVSAAPKTLINADA
jgi:hypothetical protein